MTATVKHCSKIALYCLDIFRTVICDHMRAPEFYIKSVNQCSWRVHPCKSLEDCERGNYAICNSGCSSMGFRADKPKRTGRFYLKTTSNSPFCCMLFYILVVVALCSFRSFRETQRYSNSDQQLKTAILSCLNTFNAFNRRLC